MCSYHHNILVLPLPRHHPGLALHVRQGGPGVREGGHIPAGPAPQRRFEGSRFVVFISHVLIVELLVGPEFHIYIKTLPPLKVLPA